MTHSITGAARLTGLLGWPVAHSLSPALHHYWLDKHNLDGLYAPLAVAPDRVDQAVSGLRALGFTGANVTVPHKQAVIPHVDRCDDVAQRLGAVNTIIVHKDGSLTGRNTDTYGFQQSLMTKAGAQIKQQVDENQSVSLIGAGGAARAVLDAVLTLGYQRVQLSNRTPDKAKELAAHFQQFYPQVTITVVPWDHRQDMVADCGLLVNTSSLGMHGMPPLDVDLSPMAPNRVVADIVYVPLITPLLAAAQEQGHSAVDGLDMLLYQAQAAFAAWHGVTPVIDHALRGFMLDLLRDGP
ncbi:MAG: shikimate dehydrogenase [Pseudomonadota bacterium]